MFDKLLVSMNYFQRKELHYRTKEEEEKKYNERLQEVQQQFLAHRERTTAKLNMLEELVALAVQKMDPLPKRRHEEFVYPFGRVDNRDRAPKKEAPQDSLRHLKLNFPRYEIGREVVDSIQDCELYFEIYGVHGHKKVVIAGMHLEGATNSWYQVFAICYGQDKLVLAGILYSFHSQVWSEGK